VGTANGGAVLYLPRHIVEEVERDLPRRAPLTDDIELAYRRLRTLYLSRPASLTCLTAGPSTTLGSRLWPDAIQPIFQRPSWP
jgi:hypothetical protein